MFKRFRKKILEWFFEEYLNIDRNLTIKYEQEKMTGGILAYLTQGILIFLLVFGIVGGFLSAYDILYDKATAFAVVGAVALILSAAYSSGKKSWMNVANLVVVLGYVYIAATKFWYVNSGYYSILNKVNEETHSYLSIYNGTHYIEKIANSNLAVTYFVIFVGMILVVLLNIQFAYHSGLIYVLVLTIPVMCFLVYFEKYPKPIYLVCLLSGYLSLLIGGAFRKKKSRTRLQKYVLAGSFLVVFMVVWLVGNVMPERYYTVKTGKSEAKRASENVVKDLILYGPDAIFGQSYSNTGMSGGILSSSPMVRSDYETDLIVRFTPYSLDSIYLKAYTGVEYEGNRWYPVKDIIEDDILAQIEERMIDSSIALKQMYENMDELQGRGIMEVENVGANKSYLYYPYYTDFAEVQTEENTTRFVYYPANRNVVLPQKNINPEYLKVPNSCKKAVESACKQGMFYGEPEVVATQIIDFFEENYTYSLRPGYKLAESDYITYFLKKNKKGYCAHFASSAVMMFRYMGIPARYVEGYVFSFNDVVVDGKLDETAKYEDYYNGYAPIGETGLVTLEIPDANAHAWVEIYVQGKGWIVVDPTPAASPSTEENFWDVFGNLGGQDTKEVAETDNVVGKYLERATNAVFFALPAIVMVIMFVALVRVVRKKMRVSKMTAKERMIYAYQNLYKKVRKRDKNFDEKMQTKEQMQYVLAFAKIDENSQEVCEKLYEAIFGPNLFEDDYQKLEEKINKIRGKLR